MSVHATAVVLEDRLGHESHRLAILVGNVLHDVFVEHHVVGRFDQRIELQIDLCLAAGRDFMVVALHFQAAALHGHDHFAAQILVMIGWRHREVSFLVARTITKIVLGAARVPASLFGIDKIKAVLLTLIEADIVKDEELSFSAEICSVSQAG